MGQKGIVVWWSWRPPLMLILLKIFLTQPFLRPNEWVRQTESSTFLTVFPQKIIPFPSCVGGFFLRSILLKFFILLRCQLKRHMGVKTESETDDNDERASMLIPISKNTSPKKQSVSE